VLWRLGEGKDFRPVKKCWMLVCWWWRFDWSFAVSTAAVVTTHHLLHPCSNKLQNADILVPAYPGWLGQWPSSDRRHPSQQTLLLCHKQSNTDCAVDSWTQRSNVLLLLLPFVRFATQTRENRILPRRLGGAAARWRLLLVDGRKEEPRQQMTRRRRCARSFASTRSWTFWWTNCLQARAVHISCLHFHICVCVIMPRL